MPEAVDIATTTTDWTALAMTELRTVVPFIWYDHMHTAGGDADHTAVAAVAARLLAQTLATSSTLLRHSQQLLFRWLLR